MVDTLYLAFIAMQMVPDLQWFNLGVFNSTMDIYDRHSVETILQV